MQLLVDIQYLALATVDVVGSKQIAQRSLGSFSIYSYDTPAASRMYSLVAHEASKETTLVLHSGLHTGLCIPETTQKTPAQWDILRDDNMKTPKVK